MNRACFAVVAACLGTIGIEARADEAPAVAAPAAATTTPAAPATPATAAPPAQEEVVPNEGHLRWGLSPMLGTFFPGPTTIALGFEGRVGYAFNQTVSVYGSLTAVAGLGFGEDTSANGGSLSVSAVSYWQFGANVDALVAGPLFVGGGVGIGRAGWGVVKGSASSTGGSTEVISAGGTVPTLDGRLGVMLGSLNKKTGARSGLTIALDVRVLFAPDASDTKQSANTSGGSAQSVDTTTAIGVCPMLMLGYDFR